MTREPMTCAQLVADGWTDRVREVVHREGRAVRASGLQIECQVINQPDRWMPLLLPNGGTQLTDRAEALLTLKLIL